MSVKAINDIASSICREKRLDFDKGYIDRTAIDQSFARIWDLSPEKTQQAAAAFRTLYAEKYLLEATPYPGVFTLLSRLRAAGWKVGVATYKRNDYAQRLMEKTGITGACNFVLSLEHDLTGAKDTSLHFLGVNYGYEFKTEDDVLKSGAYYATTSVEEIEKILMELFLSAVNSARFLQTV